MFDDLDLGQWYFKNLPLGGGRHPRPLQAGLTMGTGLWLVVMCLIWIGTLLQGRPLVSLLSPRFPSRFLPLAHGHQWRLFESITGRRLGGVSAVFVC